MRYDYREGKKRIEEILNNDIEIKESKTIPQNDNNFTFSNGYYNWVTAIFIDIRDSSHLFSKKALNDKQSTAKIVRSFTSEIIEILKSEGNFREIGIRGDCVYGTSKKSDILSCADLTFFINTYLDMLNKLLEKKGLHTINAGIGMATDRELIIKAGRKSSGINSKVWIGNAVTMASNLSSLGDKNGTKRINYSSLAHFNFIEELKKKNLSKNVDGWFNKKEYKDSFIYEANIIKTEFNEWIKNGMNDE